MICEVCEVRKIVAQLLVFGQTNPLEFGSKVEVQKATKIDILVFLKKFAFFLFVLLFSVHLGFFPTSLKKH